MTMIKIKKYVEINTNCLTSQSTLFDDSQEKTKSFQMQKTVVLYTQEANNCRIGDFVNYLIT